MCLRPGPRDKVRVDAEGDDLKFDVEKGRRIAGGE
jgi:hypothetical protein